MVPGLFYGKFIHEEMMQNILIIVHAPAYGSERMLSALRLATALSVDENADKLSLRIFMMSDAVTVALPAENGEAGGNLQAMLADLVSQGVQVRLCRTCALTRGIADLVLLPGVTIGTLPELAEWTLAADKVLCF